MMAREADVSANSVHRIWRAHGLQSHRVRQFKLSNGPECIDKLRDVVGFYVASPALASVLSFEETSQIQALDRSRPGLPLKKRRAGTMAHDYERNCTTTRVAQGPPELHFPLYADACSCLKAFEGFFARRTTH